MVLLKKAKRVPVSALIFLFLIIAVAAQVNAFAPYHVGLTLAPKPDWPPAGKSIRVPVTRDTGISSAEGEDTTSNGGAYKLKLKGIMEYILLDIDPTDLQGKIIAGALLHIRSASPREAPLARLGVSSMAQSWVEGSSSGYRQQIGSSCFLQAEYRKHDWAYPGSTLMDVVFGRGNTVWKFAECTTPDKDGWQTCAVDPDVVAARAAGLSYGFCLFDEVGHIWRQKRGRFRYTYFPNRMCYSRESWKSAPWLEIWINGEDTIPPEPVRLIGVERDLLPAGEALVRWDTPADHGGGKILGFQVSYERAGRKYSMPRYLIPMAGRPGEEVRMHIQDLPFRPGEVIRLSVRPVDSAGNVGEASTKTIRLSSQHRQINIPEAGIQPFTPDTDLPMVGNLKVAVVDLLDKIDPQNGNMIPERPAGYLGGNHLFSAAEKLIRLQVARNETVHFQLNLSGISSNIRVEYLFDQHPELKPKVYQFAYVDVTDKNGDTVAVLPDPLVPLDGAVSIPLRAGGQVQIADQNNLSLICEVYIPHEESPGLKQGRVVVSAGKDKLVLDVNLTIWNFTLPNKLSFIPEMNAYETVSPYKGYDYYRLAHEHRTCINRLSYGWHGIPEFAPAWNGKDFQWEEWDRNVGPLLDGSAFKDMPRKNEPVDVFYLPFNENWPVNIYDHYSPSYWVDEAFDDAYRRELGASFAAFARHCNEKQWHQTIFQFYLNNKVYHRREFNRVSAPWVFDEPIHTQDFWALRWNGILWQQSVDALRGHAEMWYRGDISFSQFGRNILWGVTDVEYFGGNTFQKTRMKRDEQILHGRSYFAEYGTANKIDASNAQPVLWCLSAWSKGALGVLPWQTIGTKKSWRKATQTSLFYPHPSGPKPSVRLKAFTRGQQDVEYLELYCAVFRRPKFTVAAWLRGLIDLNGKLYKSIETDAGTLGFTQGDPVALWGMRYRLGQMISDKAPVYRRALVKFKKPEWDPENLPRIGYVPIAPQVESYKPECDNFRPQ